MVNGRRCGITGVGDVAVSESVTVGRDGGGGGAGSVDGSRRSAVGGDAVRTGISMVNVVPRSCALSTLMLPPMSSRSSLVMKRPMPEPP